MITWETKGQARMSAAASKQCVPEVSRVPWTVFFENYVSASKLRGAVAPSLAGRAVHCIGQPLRRRLACQPKSVLLECEFGGFLARHVQTAWLPPRMITS